MTIFSRRKKPDLENLADKDSRLMEGVAVYRPRLLLYISIGVVITLAVVSYFKKDGFRELFQIDSKIEKDERMLKRLKEENELLERRIKSAREDPYHVEKFAREKLNLVKEGEVVFRFYKE